MSYEPFPLVQANQTLHGSAVYRGTLDASAFGATEQPLFTTAPHLGRFCPVTAWSHGDVMGYEETTGAPSFSLGWARTSVGSPYIDIAASGSVNSPRGLWRFAEITVIGSVASPSRSTPVGVPIFARVGTKAGSTTTGAAFTQPAIGSQVLVSLSPSANWPVIGGVVYVGTVGGAFDTYVVRARTGSSPYVSITLELLAVGAVPPGGTVPVGRTVAAAATFSIFILGNHRRARWAQ